ncbi:MAG: hypothetical protein ACT4NU_08485 [Chromatiales bacterium]
MTFRQLRTYVLISGLALGAPPSGLAAQGCEALNGRWAGSQNLVGQRDAVLANYTITARGRDVTVDTGNVSATGSCEVSTDAYVLKLNWGELTSEMTFRVVGDGVAMFFWQDSAGEGGRGSLTRESAAEQSEAP